MSIRTRQWDEPRQEGDGFRLLVSRYRPRGLPKGEETWDAWQPELGPSAALHASFYRKGSVGVTWGTYRSAYLREVRSQSHLIRELARRVAGGETITLLCSSACTREARCHRSILKELIEEEVRRLQEEGR